MSVPFAIVNKSSVLSTSQVKAYAVAQQIQINTDFAPHWGYGAHIYITDTPMPNDWVLMLLDDSDQANALGYHYETTEGQPLAKAFVKSDMQHNLSWTVTASHEVIETLVNPWIMATILTGYKNGARLWAQEACDAVESDTLGYLVGRVLLSDFVLPAWFQPNSHGPFDIRKHCISAFDVAPGGYMSVLDFLPGIQPKWTQIGVPSRHIEESPRRTKLYSVL